MTRSRIAGIGMYVPKQVVTNNDLTKYMDTSDAWIQERTGIKERRFAHRTEETTTTLGVEAAKIAIERAGTTPQEIDFIVFVHAQPRLLLSWLRRAGTACAENERSGGIRRAQPVQRLCVRTQRG